MTERRPALRRIRRALSSRSTSARVAELERELRATRRKLRRAQAQAREPQDERELQYLFVVTYGRSGSTLMQGILNSIPGYLIRGENAQMVRHLYDFHRSGKVQRARWDRWLEKNPDQNHLPSNKPFFGMDKYPHRPVLPLMRQLVVQCLLGPEDDTRVIGFKEVHWEEKDAHRFITWLQKVFPGARFVFNTRDLDAVAKSAWWGDDPDSRTKLEEYEAKLLGIAERLGDAAYRVHYDDYVDNPEALRGLFEWLGEEFDVERVRAVLAVEHSFQRKPRRDTEAVATPGTD